MPRPLFTPSVLLVEDSDDDTFLFRHALKKAAVECSLVHVADGGEALHHLRQTLASDARGPRWPDLIFLDLKLPSFNGFEILRWIGEHRPPALRAVVVLSGSDHSSDLDLARSLGAGRYIVKPISAEQLRTHLLQCSPQVPTTPSATANGVGSPA